MSWCGFELVFPFFSIWTSILSTFADLDARPTAAAAVGVRVVGVVGVIVVKQP